MQTDQGNPTDTEAPADDGGRSVMKPQEEGAERIVTRRVWRRYQPRPTRFVSSTWELDRLLDSCQDTGRQRIYLVGPRPGGGSWDGFLSWLLEADVPASWSPDGHYLGDAMLPVVRFRHVGGARVEILRAATWLGEGDYSCAQAADAMRHTLELLRWQWRSDDVQLLSTPATTGRDLWLRTIPDGQEWPVLDEQLQRLVRSTSGQGRWQHRADQLPDEIGGLYGWDMRFSYAGLVDEIGGPLVAHDDRPEWEPYARGRYRVRVTVPTDWSHIGLLGLPDPDGIGWLWPDEPGRTFTTWADGAELLVADRQGWSFDVLERLVFADGDPLRTWRDKLVRAREEAARQEQTGRIDAAHAKLVRGALRALVLHTVGAFHASGSPVTRTAPLAEADDRMPPEAAPSLVIHGGMAIWQEPQRAVWRELAHPEWSAAVWARCRSRLLTHRPTGTGALHVPAESIVSMRTDAIYLSHDAGWPDPGRVGTLRPTCAIRGPLDTPQTPDQLQAIREPRAGGRARARAGA